MEGERLSWEDVATRMGVLITSVEKEVPADSESLTQLSTVLQRMIEEGSGVGTMLQKKWERKGPEAPILFGQDMCGRRSRVIF